MRFSVTPTSILPTLKLFSTGRVTGTKTDGGSTAGQRSVAAGGGILPPGILPPLGGGSTVGQHSVTAGDGILPSLGGGELGATALADRSAGTTNISEAEMFRFLMSMLDNANAPLRAIIANISK
jgi:hypothetical protein